MLERSVPTDEWFRQRLDAELERNPEARDVWLHSAELQELAKDAGKRLAELIPDSEEIPGELTDKVDQNVMMVVESVAIEVGRRERQEILSFNWRAYLCPVWPFCPDEHQAAEIERIVPHHA
jgi:hypothetical protein